MDVEDLQTEEEPVGVLKMVELEGLSTLDPNDLKVLAELFILN